MATGASAILSDESRNGTKNASIYALWGHERIEQLSDVGKALKYYAQYPGVMQGSQRGKRANLWGPACLFRSKHINENNVELGRGRSS